MKIHSENDAIFYSIIVLKGQYESGVLQGDEYVNGKFYCIYLV